MPQKKSKRLSNLHNRPTLECERTAGYPEISVAGVDEVGRGCLAGPVIAGALILPAIIDYDRHPWLADVKDSKLVRPELREKLVPLILEWAAASAIGMASVEEIDRINIYHASHLAMKRAVEGLRIKPDHLLIDGNRVPQGLSVPATAIVKGDLKCLSIAAASLIAKVYRDRLMADMDERYPGFGFSVHKGYSTPAHARAILAQGVCELHRRSFAPVAVALTVKP